MKIYDREGALALVDNDEDLLQMLLDSFLSENKFERSHLEALIKNERMSEAASYVHATKGAARQLCMEKLKESGQKLEDVLRGKATGEIQILVDRMFRDYEEVVEMLSC